MKSAEKKKKTEKEENCKRARVSLTAYGIQKRGECDQKWLHTMHSARNISKRNAKKKKNKKEEEGEEDGKTNKNSQRINFWWQFLLLICVKMFMFCVRQWWNFISIYSYLFVFDIEFEWGLCGKDIEVM